MCPDFRKQINRARSRNKLRFDEVTLQRSSIEVVAPIIQLLLTHYRPECVSLAVNVSFLSQIFFSFTYLLNPYCM